MVLAASHAPARSFGRVRNALGVRGPRGGDAGRLHPHQRQFSLGIQRFYAFGCLSLKFSPVEPSAISARSPCRPTCPGSAPGTAARESATPRRIPAIRGRELTGFPLSRAGNGGTAGKIPAGAIGRVAAGAGNPCGGIMAGPLGFYRSYDPGLRPARARTGPRHRPRLQPRPAGPGPPSAQRRRGTGTSRRFSDTVSRSGTLRQWRDHRVSPSWPGPDGRGRPDGACWARTRGVWQPEFLRPR